MNFYLKSLIALIVVSLLLFGIHSVVFPESPIELYKIHAFLAIAGYLSMAALNFVHQIASDKLGFVFIGLLMVKIGALIIVFPEILSDEVALSKVDKLHLLVPYFIYLFLETALVIKWLNHK